MLKSILNGADGDVKAKELVQNPLQFSSGELPNGSQVDYGCLSVEAESRVNPLRQLGAGMMTAPALSFIDDMIFEDRFDFGQFGYLMAFNKFAWDIISELLVTFFTFIGFVRDGSVDFFRGYDWSGFAFMVFLPSRFSSGRAAFSSARLLLQSIAGRRFVRLCLQPIMLRVLPV